MRKEIRLSEHFTFKKLLRFTLPSIAMMVFGSVYSIIDGVFVSNFVGKTSFAAVNLMMPFLMMFSSVGFMVGTGGSALIAKTLGEKNSERARKLFSVLVYLLAAVGVVMSIISSVFIREIAVWLGATGEMLGDCVLYARICLISLAAFMLQNAFQAFLVAAERPKMGFLVTAVAGIANIVLDFLFIVVLDWGLKGAAIATVVAQSIGGLAPLVYFALPNRSLLRLGKPLFDAKALLRVCTNSSSELVTNLSMSLVNMLYNFQLMRYVGESGVVAFGVIMYVCFIFLSVYMGYSIGSAPIVSFNYGAENHNELRAVLRKSLTLIFFMSLAMTAASELLARGLASVFVGYDTQLLDFTTNAFRLYALSFLFAGFNIYSSSFFTALNNGLVSAGISFSRTLLFETAAVLLLPCILGVKGIWLSMTFAELFAFVLSCVMLVALSKRYHYR